MKNITDYFHDSEPVGLDDEPAGIRATNGKHETSHVRIVPEYCLGSLQARPHFLIEGDNYDALLLLAKTHRASVDFIYIDPPYNTGNTGMTYNDKFATSKDKHGPWLSFLERRLRVALDILAEDGIITISIDDREYAHLKLLCDAIFGEDNYLATLVWHSKYTVANDSRFFSRQHEYVLVYAKTKAAATIGRLPRSEKSDRAYRNPDNDERGPWKATPIHAKSGSKTSRYSITFPNGRTWTAPAGRFPRYSRERLLALYEDNRLWFGKNPTSSISAKTFLSEVAGIVPGTVLPHEIVGHTHAANEQLANLVGKGSFDNPKPVQLIEHLLRLGCTKSDAIVLDFFAGSGTTAEAVARLNKADGGKRQALLCTSNENNICIDVTFARLQAVHTGSRFSTSNVDPIPLPLRYLRITTEASFLTREAFAELVTGLTVSKTIGSQRSGVVLGQGEAVLVHRFNKQISKKIAQLREFRTIRLLGSPQAALELCEAGYADVSVIP